MKKIITILALIVISISMTSCTINNSDQEKFKEEYESENNKKSKSGNKNRVVTIPKDNPIVYSTAKEISNKMDNKETFVVYFGFSTCPWCRSIIEELLRCAKDNNVDKLYYVDVSNIRDEKELDEDNNIKTVKEGTPDYLELRDKMSNVLEDYTLTNEDNQEINTNEKRIYAPNVVAVVDGKAIELETGISSKLESPYDKLTKNMRQETYNKFKCLFKCLEKTETACKNKAC